MNTASSLNMHQAPISPDQAKTPSPEDIAHCLQLLAKAAIEYEKGLPEQQRAESNKQASTSAVNPVAHISPAIRDAYFERLRPAVEPISPVQMVRDIPPISLDPAAEASMTQASVQKKQRTLLPSAPGFPGGRDVLWDEKKQTTFSMFGPKQLVQGKGQTNSSLSRPDPLAEKKKRTSHPSARPELPVQSVQQQPHSLTRSTSPKKSTRGKSLARVENFPKIAPKPEGAPRDGCTGSLQQPSPSLKSSTTSSSPLSQIILPASANLITRPLSSESQLTTIDSRDSKKRKAAEIEEAEVSPAKQQLIERRPGLPDRSYAGASKGKIAEWRTEITRDMSMARETGMIIDATHAKPLPPRPSTYEHQQSAVPGQKPSLMVVLRVPPMKLAKLLSTPEEPYDSDATIDDPVTAPPLKADKAPKNTRSKVAKPSNPKVAPSHYQDWAEEDEQLVEEMVQKQSLRKGLRKKVALSAKAREAMEAPTTPKLKTTRASRQNTPPAPAKNKTAKREMTVEASPSPAKAPQTQPQLQV